MSSQQILDQPIQFEADPCPIHQPMVPVPPMIWPLCCPRVGGPPDFTLLEDRRMEWSPIQPDASGSSVPWTFQWLCLTCSRTFSVNDVPSLPKATCPGCQQRRVCSSCNHMVTIPDAVAERHDWFSSGPLSRLGPLHSWGASSPKHASSVECRWHCPRSVSRSVSIVVAGLCHMTNPVVMMGHPVLVAPRQASCSTSQSLPPASQDSLTPSEFAGVWFRYIAADDRRVTVRRTRAY